MATSNKTATEAVARWAHGKLRIYHFADEERLEYRQFIVVASSAAEARRRIAERNPIFAERIKRVAPTVVAADTILEFYGYDVGDPVFMESA